MNLQLALYLIPTNISDAPFSDYFSEGNNEIIKQLRFFIVENVRTARRFLKKTDASINISDLTFYELNGHTDPREVYGYLQPLREGEAIGIMSEAGCPGIADPGALPVSIAQSEGLKVIPLAGPSSILMSLMASGLNGQRFAFNGYLPVEPKEREHKIRELEQFSIKHDMTQIFIETPYRNGKMMESLLKTLKAETMLCVASDITDPSAEKIITKPISLWRKDGNEIGKCPAIFLIHG